MYRHCGAACGFFSLPPLCPLRAREGCWSAPHRTAIAHCRVTAAELEEWRAKAESAGTTLSKLMRAAMRRTRTWTAEDSAAVRERTREVARIGVNLNQISRWANRYRGAADAAQVIAHLVALDRDVRELVLTRDPDLPPRDEAGPC